MLSWSLCDLAQTLCKFSMNIKLLLEKSISNFYSIEANYVNKREEYSILAILHMCSVGMERV